MKLAIVGTGYIGLVAATRFAEIADEVFCVDIDRRNSELMPERQRAIEEPQLHELVARHRRAGRLRFTTDIRAAVRDSRVIFVAVDMPHALNGIAYRCRLRSVIDSVADAMNDVIEPRQEVPATPPADPASPLCAGLAPNPMW